MVTYINRYKDIYTFTPDNEGNILWEGPFEWCRIGWPNDYSKAYQQYFEDSDASPKIEFEAFKKEIEENFHNKDHFTHKYTMLVESNRNKIDMVDPSGGPYIKTGMDMGYFGKEFKGKIVEDFERVETGYKLLIKK